MKMFWSPPLSQRDSVSFVRHFIWPIKSNFILIPDPIGKIKCGGRANHDALERRRRVIVKWFGIVGQFHYLNVWM